MEVNSAGPAVNLSSTGSDESSDHEDCSSRSRRNTGNGRKLKRAKVELPDGFLEPIKPVKPQMELEAVRNSENGGAVLGSSPQNALVPEVNCCRQFWQAGEDFDGVTTVARPGVGMDHVRVHPKFLHSNATSHKWALGAIAELLDNAVDEADHGATLVNIDILKNPRDGSPMLLVEDNGGGMSPDKMRQCMSFGYSEKSKKANTIGQYGNGFKTSTMRLGADVVVFTKTPGNGGQSPTRSIGLLSYTFLRGTHQSDIIVPMIDFEDKSGLQKVIRSNEKDWLQNLETIKAWSPYSSEQALVDQLKKIRKKGTRLLVYNLWQDDQGQLELDIESDPKDVQIRGARDNEKILLAKKYKHAKHYFTYRHSLRSYASILYLRLPKGFTIILRGQEVKPHNIINDMMETQEVVYKPQGGAESFQSANMVATVTIGFIKDAKEHIDVQGFNVYHKNRLIKPFWRIWNSASSGGRGVIGVLEANFVEPAHDKQGFERTNVLQRLETRLVQMQKNFWNNNAHKVGYQSSAKKKADNNERERDDWEPSSSRRADSSKRTRPLKRKRVAEGDVDDGDDGDDGDDDEHDDDETAAVAPLPLKKTPSSSTAKPSRRTSPPPSIASKSVIYSTPLSFGGVHRAITRRKMARVDVVSGGPLIPMDRMKEVREENEILAERVKKLESARDFHSKSLENEVRALEEQLVCVQQELGKERDELRIELQEESKLVMEKEKRCKDLEDEIEEERKKNREMRAELDTEKKIRREIQEELKHYEHDDATLRKQLKNANRRIAELQSGSSLV